MGPSVRDVNDPLPRSGATEHPGGRTDGLPGTEPAHSGNLAREMVKGRAGGRARSEPLLPKGLCHGLRVPGRGWDLGRGMVWGHSRRRGPAWDPIPDQANSAHLVPSPEPAVQRFKGRAQAQGRTKRVWSCAQAWPQGDGPPGLCTEPQFPKHSPPPKPLLGPTRGIGWSRGPGRDTPREGRHKVLNLGVALWGSQEFSRLLPSLG